jgi:hypothetical protein
LNISPHFIEKVGRSQLAAFKLAESGNNCDVSGKHFQSPCATIWHQFATGIATPNITSTPLKRNIP